MRENIRPNNLAEFVGQRDVVGQVEAILAGAERRGEQPGHLLFTGPKGLGKTSMARLVAAERGAELVEVDGHALTAPSDIIALLGSLSDGDFLFIDEIHRLPRPVEEALYKPLEDFTAFITDGKGAVRPLALSRFTCVGATTSSGKISAPLRERFSAELCFDWYPAEDLAAVCAGVEAKISSPEFPFVLEQAARLLLASHGRGTPRQVINLLKRLRDYKADELPVSEAEVQQALSMMRVSPLGLGLKDVAYLHALSEREGQPVGIRALAAITFEDDATLENEIEPFLLAQGFIDLTPGGRVLTRAGHDYLSDVR